MDTNPDSNQDMPQKRNPVNLRIREGKKAKLKQLHQSFAEDVPKKKKKRGEPLEEGDVQMPKKKRKSKVHQNSGSMNDLQSVEEFRHFLLQNDSNFTDYVNSNLVLSIFDSHLMREGMISMMAQVLGNGQTKDNFFLLTRQAIQDTLALFYVAKNISFNNQLEFYLPRLVEIISDLLDVERCSIFLYDGIKDNLFCKVITGRLREPIQFARESKNVLCTVFNTG